MTRTSFISLAGNLETRQSYEQRFWSYVDKTTGENSCWPWLGGSNTLGYGKFKLYGRMVMANRLAYALGHSIDPGALYVCHVCDNPPCCNPKHLWLGTNQDNQKDCAAKGRKNIKPLIGENNPRAKLKDHDVNIIRGLIELGFNNQEIAEKFSVTHHTISKIRTGAAWMSVVGRP